MKLFKKKINRQKGFSLAETLVAVLIILLVSSVVAAGMPAAQKAYNNVLETADAQLFMSTVLTELRNELTTATNIKVSGNTVTYDHPVTGSSKIEYKAGTGTIEVTSYMDLDTNAKPRPIVTEAAKTKSLKLVFTGAPFSSPADHAFSVGAFDITSSKTNNSVLAHVNGYSFNVLAP